MPQPKRSGIVRFLDQNKHQMDRIPWSWSEDSIPTTRQQKNSMLRDFWGLVLGVSAVVFTITSSLPYPAEASTTKNTYEWDLLNGSVTLTDPIHLTFYDRNTKSLQSISFTKPEIVGAGSGGAVFAFDPTSVEQRDWLLKISWEGTTKTVQRECATLQLLEDRKVQAAERCLGTFQYPGDTKESRTMILVSPFMRDAVANVADIDNPAAKIVAVDQIARTLVQMLAANIVTIDVQPLISKTTGQTIFIDMTEAQVLLSSQHRSSLEETLISSFVSEMVALIPDTYWETAKISILDELDLVASRSGEVDLSHSLRSLLENQTPFLAEQ